MPATFFDFKKLFESVPDLYLILDCNLNILDMSEAYLQATLIKREEVIGRNIFDVFPDNPNDPNATGVHNLSESFKRVLQTKKSDTMAVQKYDIRLPESKEGKFEERYWSPINTPILNEKKEVEYIIHRVEDVTEIIRLKQAQTEQSKLTEELRTRSGQMELEIYQRAQEIQKANKQLRTAIEELQNNKKIQEELYQRLEEYDKLKTQFFANVSHELRTPLTLILGRVGILKSDTTIKSNNQEQLNVIEKNAYILLKLVNDLLDIAKLDAGKLKPKYEEINLAQLIRLTAENFSTIAQEKNIEYSIQTPEELTAQVDPEKIQRVVLNLLANAFKFAPTQGKILCCLMIKHKHAVLIVTDNGPGVAKNLRHFVFERFQQVEGSRQSGGTGLGLSLVKDFVEMQKGKVSIKDAKDGGAKFVVILPLLAPENTVIHPTVQSGDEYMQKMSKASVLELKSTPRNAVLALHSNKPLILIVEDNQEMSHYLIDILTKDFNVITAINGKEGLEKAKGTKPDLILSDMMMPEMTGEEMVYQIRQIPELNDTSIILLTAKSDESLRLQLLRNGIQDYILKPFSEEELRARINILINLKKAKAELKQKNTELNQIAFLDTLTGLANRAQLFKTLKTALFEANSEKSKIAILFLDLDRFKIINDTLGHKIGDILLQIVAKRIKSVVHENDIVSRLGGDEFVILLKRIPDKSSAGKIAERVINQIKREIVIRNNKLFVTCSIGVSVYPEDGKDDQTLIKQADIAMYSAKQAGRNNYHIFNTEMSHHIHHKMAIENTIRNALENKTLIIHYHPQVNLTNGTISAVEALLRLPQADGSILYPNKFLSIAEDTGLIVPIGEWLLKHAILDFQKYITNEITQINNDQPIRLAINFSARQLDESDFVTMVKNVLTETNFDPHCLEFEITESPLISNMDTSKKIISEIKALGISITLDDFGVGFSSLSYLRQIPLDTLKLDPTLFKNIPGDQIDSNLIVSIINLSHAMGLQVVAEGAETEDQIIYLKNNHCDKIQSYYFSRPLTIDELVSLIKNKTSWEIIQKQIL